MVRTILRRYFTYSTHYPLTGKHGKFLLQVKSTMITHYSKPSGFQPRPSQPEPKAQATHPPTLGSITLHARSTHARLHSLGEPITRPHPGLKSHTPVKGHKVKPKAFWSDKLFKNIVQPRSRAKIVRCRNTFPYNCKGNVLSPTLVLKHPVLISLPIWPNICVY